MRLNRIRVLVPLAVAGAITAVPTGAQAVGPPEHSNAGCVAVAVQHPEAGGGPPGQFQSEQHVDRFGYTLVSPTAHRPHGCF